MVIFSTEQVSPEVIKISSDAGLAFFIRTKYLKIVKAEEICKDASFSEEKEEDILDAGMIFSAERKALDYLARAEQNRFGLTNKLINKKYEKRYIEPALDYLEEINYLNDLRFSESWLNARKINHYEGRTKLNAELLNRGISREIINKALDSFFEENDEEELCVKCMEKLRRTGKAEEKLVNALLQKGFSYSMVKNVIKSYS